MNIEHDGRAFMLLVQLQKKIIARYLKADLEALPPEPEIVARSVVSISKAGQWETKEIQQAIMALDTRPSKVIDQEINSKKLEKFVEFYLEEWQKAADSSASNAISAIQQPGWLENQAALATQARLISEFDEEAPTEWLKNATTWLKKAKSKNTPSTLSVQDFMTPDRFGLAPIHCAVMLRQGANAKTIPFLSNSKKAKSVKIVKKFRNHPGLANVAVDEDRRASLAGVAIRLIEDERDDRLQPMVELGPIYWNGLTGLHLAHFFEIEGGATPPQVTETVAKTNCFKRPIFEPVTKNKNEAYNPFASLVRFYMPMAFLEIEQPYLSPGRIKELALDCAEALYYKIHTYDPQFGTLGAWAGERLNGASYDKLRKDGKLSQQAHAEVALLEQVEWELSDPHSVRCQTAIPNGDEVFGEMKKAWPLLREKFPDAKDLDREKFKEIQEKRNRAFESLDAEFENAEGDEPLNAHDITADPNVDDKPSTAGEILIRQEDYRLISPGGSARAGLSKRHLKVIEEIFDKDQPQNIVAAKFERKESQLSREKSQALKKIKKRLL